MEIPSEQNLSGADPQRKCSKKGCKIMVPIDFKYQACDKCGAGNRNNQKASRKRAAAKTTADSSTSGSCKRRRDSTTSVDARPAVRPRTVESTVQNNTDEDVRSGREELDSETESVDDNMDVDMDVDGLVEMFSDPESFCEALRAEFMSGTAVDFHGTYILPVDPLVSPKERVQMVAAEIWRISGYRFTVKDHRPSKTGHQTRFWCSQDEDRKKKSKSSQNPDIRNCENVGMKCYPCGSKLVISCRTGKDANQLNVTVQLKHVAGHIIYNDVTMPRAALDMIRENVEWLTPVAMVSKVQATFPKVSAAQVHRAWTEMSEIFWRRDDAQLPSAEKLLHEHGDDVDVFRPEDVPEGVEMLCWGMKKIAGPLRGKIVEIGVDATYNTNSKHLELYSIIGEYDNTGFPLSYLLLSTASSIDQAKRRRALTAWAKCLRAIYGIHTQFTHVDKDMVEIGMLKDVWNSKISLCWWHLRRAVRTRLATAKLPTTPYDPGRAHEEFTFIDLGFVPQGQADMGEYEGGTPETITPIVPPSQRSHTFTAPNGLRITLPARPARASSTGNVSTESEAAALPETAPEVAAPSRPPLVAIPETLATQTDPSTQSYLFMSGDVSAEKENSVLDTHGTVKTRAGRTAKFTYNAAAAGAEALELAAQKTAPKPRTKKAPSAPVAGTGARAETAKKTAAGTARGGDADTSESDEDGGEDTRHRHTFCPARLREPIINMMEKHYCAHPLLPGYAPPNPEGIKRWAVAQMYKFCVEHGLREVWAYLWENWYRRSRWELWARSCHPEIPVLKTTMILESHWRRIKHDFLHHFHMPRCDLLVWIIIVKLAPTYYRKLDNLLGDTGRYRELPSWRKDFKRAWRKLEKVPITLPVNDAYKTDAKKMLCTCPSLPTSRFLICKHTVQGVQRVPPVFFLEVKRRRTAPFWVHASLCPLTEEADASLPENTRNESTSGTEIERVPPNMVPDWDDIVDDDDDDDDIVDTQKPGNNQPTFLEAMDENIDVILEFAKGLKYQRQFRNQRMLQALEHEGASFLRPARACLKKKQLNSTRGPAPSTWDRSSGSAMFY
ncbi:hypothetical protein C8J57DRAFT_1566088 [Mycena rebaudengoi]|nr:hypothetical protein C8J57DRAFT_1566088 [Mycena rebaudengoi]